MIRLSGHRLPAVFALAFALSVAGLAACDSRPAHGEDEHGHGAEAEGEGEEGPHGGRLLREGDFALEVTIFEVGTEPEFRLYAFENGVAVAPDKVTASVSTTRLEGTRETFSFVAEDNYLKGSGSVGEPHSFDVAVDADYAGKAYAWTYESSEGRTTIAAEAAAEADVKTAVAGPATIREIVALTGRIALTPGGRAEVKAWYPGRIIDVKVKIGDRVKRGDPVAVVEARDSLKAYTIPAPISGVVLERALNMGDVADQQAIAIIGDPTMLQAEFHVFPRDAERVRAGQAIAIHSLNGVLRAISKIEAFLPATEASTQTLTARASLPNPDEAWRAGMSVEGDVAVAEAEAAIAVKASALQRMGEGEVVFIRVGDIYEARPVEIGRRDEEWVEVISGLAAGQVYVSENSFLIRADIEKSGAAHEH